MLGLVWEGLGVVGVSVLIIEAALASAARNRHERGMRGCLNMMSTTRLQMCPLMTHEMLNVRDYVILSLMKIVLIQRHNNIGLTSLLKVDGDHLD